MRAEIAHAVRILEREVLRLEAQAWRLIETLVLTGAAASVILMALAVWVAR